MKEIKSLVSIMVLLLVSIVYAGTNQNFQKAGEELLKKSNNLLIAKEKEINSYIKRMTKDGYVSFLELAKLSRMIKKFTKTKKKLDKRLKIFGLKTNIELNPHYKKIIKIYSKGTKDNDQEDIRKFFVSISGKDIKVEDGGYFFLMLFLIIELIILAGLIVGVFPFVDKIWSGSLFIAGLYLGYLGVILFIISFLIYSF